MDASGAKPRADTWGSARFPVLNAACAPSLPLILPLQEEPRGGRRIHRGFALVTSSNLRFYSVRPTAHALKIQTWVTRLDDGLEADLWPG